MIALRRLWRATLRLAPLATLLGCVEASDGASEEPLPGGMSGGHGQHVTAGGGGHPGAGGLGGAAGSAGSGGGASAGGAGGSGGASAGASAGEGGTDDAGVDGASSGEGGGGAVAYPRIEAALIGEPISVVSGFALAESPLWDHCGAQLLFTDVQGGAGDSGVVHTLSASGELGVLMSDTSNANGIALDVDGSLILSQMGDGGHLARRDREGMVQVIEPDGSPNLHTPDDVIVRSDGTIYFSDGDFVPIGSLFGYLSTLPIYMLRPGGAELIEVGSVVGPNGIEFSPDEETLYVSAYGAGAVVRFSVAEDGALTKGDELIGDATSADSLCVDAAGNVYIGTRSGLQIVRDDGEKVAMIPIPGGSLTTGTTSCTFGGDDGTTLFITSWTTLYRVDDMPIPGQDWLVNRDRAHCMP